MFVVVVLDGEGGFVVDFIDESEVVFDGFCVVGVYVVWLMLLMVSWFG